MIPEKMLAEAVAEFNAAMLNALPNESDCKHIFSSRFEHKMKKVLRKANHPASYKIIQRVASFVLVLFLSFMTLLAISPTVRAAVFGWIREQFDNLVQYSYLGIEPQNNKSSDYYLSYIPDGYEEIERSETPGGVVIHYKKETTNQFLHFIYSKNNSLITYYLDNQEHIREEFKINGISIEFYTSNNENLPNALLWIDKKSDTFLCISSYEEKNEIIKIFNNIKKEN